MFKTYYYLLISRFFVNDSHIDLHETLTTKKCVFNEMPQRIECFILKIQKCYHKIRDGF